MTEVKTEKSLQETYAPNNICFGCGPEHESGLRISSFPRGEEVIADWEPEPKYQAFAGVLYGGLIGCLLDCHCNWTAIWHLIQQNKLEKAPCTVTAKYSLKFLRPTPMDKTIRLVAKVVDSAEDRATVKGELKSGNVTCAVFEGLFVSVKPGHPAYHRW